MNETLGRWHFWLTFIGVYCVFMPMHYLGLAGNVRRYSAFTDEYLSRSSAASLHHDRGVIHRGGAADFPLQPDPQPLAGTQSAGQSVEATTLEWSTSSPPPHDNFGGRQRWSAMARTSTATPTARLRDAGRPAMSTAVLPPSPSVPAAARVATGDAPRASVAQTGVWIGIATISMSFAALTSALVVRQSSAPDWQHFQLRRCST